MNKTHLLLLLTVLISALSCQTEIDHGNLNDPITAPVYVSASVTGKIIDENDMPIVGATVRFKTHTTTTDNKGLFSFPPAMIDKYAGIVTVEKPGYFKGIRTFTSREAGRNFVKIKLLKKTVAGTINAATGGSVQFGNSSITFTSNSFINKLTGVSYNGQVTIYAANIDPTATEMPLIVPGSLQAVTNSNTRSLLTSYGMMAVEMVGQSGEEIQLAANSNARLKFSIPAALRASAPASLPLWYLDETIGLWKEEGSATRAGDYYEGDVSHFSFWNCDVSVDAVFIEMVIQTFEGSLPNTLVKITRINSNTFTYGYTDSTGYVSGFVPNGEPLKLEIFNTCIEPVYSQNIGPLSQNTNLGVLTLTLPTHYSVSFTGSGTNCNNQPVTSGFAVIYFEGQNYTTRVTNGNFSLQITRCSNASANAEIFVFDQTSNQQSAVFTGAVTAGVLNAGTLQACTNSTATFIDYTLDGNNFLLISPADTVHAEVMPSGQTIIRGYRLGTTVDINFDFIGFSPGTYPMNRITNVNQFDSITIVQPLNVNVITFGQQGQFIEGNFSGTFTDITNSSTHTLSANFRVRRL